MEGRQKKLVLAGLVSLIMFTAAPQTAWSLDLDHRRWFIGGSPYVDPHNLDKEAEGIKQDGPIGEGDVCSTNLVGNDAAEQIFNFFIARGRQEGILITPEQAAGILGNLYHESGLDPTIREQGNNGEGQGIAQWSYGRRLRLYDWAGQRGLDFNALGVQLEYLWWELQGPENIAFRDLLRQTTIAGATFSFMDKFERPGILAFDSRLSAAQGAFLSFSGNDPPDIQGFCGGGSASKVQ